MPCPNDIRIPDMIHIFYQAVKGMRFEDLPPDKQEVGKNLAGVAAGLRAMRKV